MDGIPYMCVGSQAKRAERGMCIVHIRSASPRGRASMILTMVAATALASTAVASGGGEIPGAGVCTRFTPSEALQAQDAPAFSPTGSAFALQSGP